MTNPYKLETDMLRDTVKEHVAAFNLENGNPFDLEHFMSFIKDQIETDYSPRCLDTFTKYTRYKITFKWGGKTHSCVSRFKTKHWDKKAMDAWKLVYETISSMPIWDALEAYLADVDYDYVNELSADIIKPVIVDIRSIKSSVTGLTHYKVMSMNSRCKTHMKLFSSREEVQDFICHHGILKTHLH